MMSHSELVGAKSIPFRLIEQKGETNSLVIILPGAGYSTQAPLLHFTTGLFFSKGFNVLHINYSFNRQEQSELSEKAFSRDVQLAINNAIKNKKYSHYYVVAKSIGTIALSYLLNNPMFKHSKVVWLTPLLQRDDVFYAMLNSINRGLCIIGDKDRCFVEERFDRLKNNDHLLLKVVTGGNHSLELDEEPIRSIEVFKDVIFDMNEF
jgi:hypothetical protein